MNNDTSNTEASNDHLWESFCLKAHEAYIHGATKDASKLWLQSARIAEDFPSEDPRRCSAQNNTGLLYFLDGMPQKSETALKVSLDGWQKSKNWTASMEVTGTAKSSLFHHRLEVHHQDSFKDHNRARYGNWIDGAEAITRFNLAIVLTSMNRKVEGMEHLSKALGLREQTFGETNPELAIILNAMAAFSDNGGKAAQYLNRAQKAESSPTRNSLERWHGERPQVMNDTRRLLGAICMTVMLSKRDFS